MIGRDAALVTGSRFMQNALGFALSIAVVHRFGLAGVGLLTIASVGVVIQASLLTFGLPYVLARSDASIGQRNALGATMAGVAQLVALPVGAALGVLYGHDAREAAVIALLSLGGPYFAQSSIAEALLVLQGKTGRIALSTLGGLLGLAVAYLVAEDFLVFATILAIGRFSGLACLFASLPCERFGAATLREHLRRGTRFLLPDMLGLLAEQASVAIVSMLTSRAELGVFGLCRQLLTVGDTPLWSRLVAWYPRLCAEPAAARTLERQMLARGLGFGAALAALAPALGTWVFHSPEVVRLGPLMMCCVPFRYVAGTAEMTLRAMSDVAAVHRVTLLRCALVALLPIGLWCGGLTGAVLAMILQIALVAVLARRMVAAASRRHTDGSSVYSAVGVSS